MNTQHFYSVSIPLNVEDLDAPNGIDIPFNEVKFQDFLITEDDYNNLFDLFTDFNKTFDIIIDEYEEEIIRADQIDIAINLTEQYKDRGSAETKASADKLLVALKRAKELGRQILLAF